MHAHESIKHKLSLLPSKPDSMVRTHFEVAARSHIEGIYDQAMSEYRLALVYASGYESGVIMRELADCHRRLGQLEDARKLIEKALRALLYHSYPRCHIAASVTLALIQAQQGQYEDAQATYNRLRPRLLALGPAAILASHQQAWQECVEQFSPNLTLCPA